MGNRKRKKKLRINRKDKLPKLNEVTQNVVAHQIEFNTSKLWLT